MPSYLVLGNLTDQGIRTIKQGPERLQGIKQAAQAAGGRVIFFYLTMGQHDFAALLELPNDEAAARILLAAGAQGSARTTTLRAFTEEEYGKIIASLP